MKNEFINMFSSVLLELNFSFTDAPEPFQMRYQDPATVYMESLIAFNKHLLFLITAIVVMIGWMVLSTIASFEEFFSSEVQDFYHSTSIETAWTCIPTAVLLGLSIPSFNLLYASDEDSEPRITLKIIGNQWFWRYEISDWNNLFACMKCQVTKIKYTCYMLPDSEIQDWWSYGYINKLETNRRVYLPADVCIRLLVTSMDVLHSWTIPSFGVKIDACPGRLNQVLILIKRAGVFFGQCSEICGVNHGFMPIAILVMEEDQFYVFICDRLGKIKGD